MPSPQIITWVGALLISLLAWGQRAKTARSEDGVRQEAQQRPAAPDEWQRAEREIRRVPPSVFPELPVEVVKQLEAHGCLIPQVAELPGRHNVIRGQFARKGETPMEDRGFLQVIGEGPLHQRGQQGRHTQTLQSLRWPCAPPLDHEMMDLLRKPPWSTIVIAGGGFCAGSGLIRRLAFSNVC